MDWRVVSAMYNNDLLPFIQTVYIKASATVNLRLSVDILTTCYCIFQTMSKRG